MPRAGGGTRSVFKHAFPAKRRPLLNFVTSKHSTTIFFSQNLFLGKLEEKLA